MVSINLKYCHSFSYAGLLRQPKWGHLKDLHRAIKLCEPALVSGDATVIPLGNYQEVKFAFCFLWNIALFQSCWSFCNFVFNVQAHVFNYKAGGCAAFLANYHQRSFAKVSFRNMHYNLPPWSISILPDCKNTVYNTARVRISIKKINFFCFSLLHHLDVYFIEKIATFVTKFPYRLVLKVQRSRWLLFLCMEACLGKRIMKSHPQVVTTHSLWLGCWSR